MQQTLKLVARRVSGKTAFRPSRYSSHGMISFLVFLCCCSAILRSEESSATSRGSAGHLAEIVRALCARLRIDSTIEVRIDDRNSKMVSSQPLSGASSGYLLSFDRRFLEDLDEDEIAGAIAHELGHIWIFSHHPYLQTEELANEVALQVVTRETMKKVYGKMWAHTGTAGDIDELLGPIRESGNSKAARVIQ